MVDARRAGSTGQSAAAERGLQWHEGRGQPEGVEGALKRYGDGADPLVSMRLLSGRVAGSLAGAVF